MGSRADAQRRADRIRAFREELAALRTDGASPLTTDQEAAIAAHHAAVLAGLAADFDVDRSERSGQLSRGLQIASFFGGATLVAAIFSLVSRYWGHIDLPAQVTLLALFPLLALAGVEISARRERTRYVASLFALVACGAAWLAVELTARLLNLALSVLFLWPWILFCLAVALSYGFRLVLAGSIAMMIVAIAGGFFAAAGSPWPQALARVEPLMMTAFAVALMARRLEPAGEGFGATVRLVGVVMGLGALLVVSESGENSLLPLSTSAAEAVYQGLMLVASITCINVGLRLRMREVAMTAAVMLAIFLLVRYTDWFWDVLPAWAFFLTMAILAFAAIALLRRERRRWEAA